MSDYQIIPDNDPARFAVKITFASGHSRIQRGFRTEADAKGWLESERNKEAEPHRQTRSGYLMAPKRRR
jgi:hypothetical protein